MCNVCFLFGAGAEFGLGFPSGAKYVQETLLYKREKMYNALSDFYTGRLDKDYINSYIKEYLFANNSNALEELVGLSTKNAIKVLGFENCDAGTRQYYERVIKPQEEIERDRFSTNSRKKVEKEIDEAKTNMLPVILSCIIQHEENNNGKKITGKDSVSESAEKTESFSYSSLRDNLVYYGVVERDFATIIHPEKGGKKVFWRLINFYWSAFFSIFLPLCKLANPDWYPKDNDSKVATEEQYEAILHDFPSRIKEVIETFQKGNEFYNNNTIMAESYYSVFKNHFPNSSAITTNYTPFIEHYYGRESIYLAGKLSEFEFPKELKVEDVCTGFSKDNWNDAFVFPFIMTQAPIKPIIVSQQIKQYAAATEALKKTDALVVVGYSLGEEDNHIISILREYIASGKKRFVFCKHYDGSEPFNVEKEKENVLGKLRITSKEMADCVVVIPNNGKAAELVDQIKKCLS